MVGGGDVPTIVINHPGANWPEGPEHSNFLSIGEYIEGNTDGRITSIGAVLLAD